MSSRKIEIFSFYLDAEVQDKLCNEITHLLYSFIKSREWSIEEPQIFLSDAPIDDGYKVAFELKLYSAKEENLDIELDKKAYHDVLSTINFMEQVSKKFNLDIEFDLGGVFVGAIDNGKQSETLSIGLLGEWKKHLNL